MALLHRWDTFGAGEDGVDVQGDLSRCALDIISSIAFGIEMDATNDPESKWATVADTILKEYVIVTSRNNQLHSHAHVLRTRCAQQTFPDTAAHAYVLTYNTTVLPCYSSTHHFRVNLLSFNNITPRTALQTMQPWFMKWFPIGRQAHFEAQVEWAKAEIHRRGLDSNVRANSVLGMLRAAQETHGK